MSSSEFEIEILFDALAAHTCRCLVFNYEGTAERLDAIRSRLAGSGIGVETRESESSPTNVAVFVSGERVIDVIAIDEWWPESLSIEGVLDGRAVNPPEIPDAVAAAVTVLPEASKLRLIAVSREFEQRAMRCGGGRLAVGFQYLSTLANSERTRAVYERLAAAGVDVTVHGVPDASVDSLPVETSHDGAEQYGQYWFMLYDGDGEPDRKAVLVARDRDDGSYEGYWSVDPAVTDELIRLAERESVAPFRA
ncbi:hypothetical protein [Halovenus marina]|uniref:hypothetical protein n=1 Tax=Halovenus marina TaxID=3396621 RepID=UPI003F55EACC